jgi:glutamyl-Q tRNA(Asp) synthetase
MCIESTNKTYLGRFAPSPTGPLHFGSLVTAVASYCDAKANDGKWLLRMEDLDKPREQAGASDMILRQLEGFGFEWDSEVSYQSQRSDLYAEALKLLQNKDLTYPCTCTRKEIVDSTISHGIEGVVYPKTCLQHAVKTNIEAAWRIKTPAEKIAYIDTIQGKISQTLSQDVGDFILKRADGLFAYQLAVVVDDAAQNISNVVRGADLLDSTPRQMYLQQLLNLPTPDYAHVPVASNTAGEKLSKQTRAQPISTSLARHQLFDALVFLGQQPPAAIKNATLGEAWRWAIANWGVLHVPKLRSIVANF